MSTIASPDIIRCGECNARAEMIDDAGKCLNCEARSPGTDLYASEITLGLIEAVVRKSKRAPVDCNAFFRLQNPVRFNRLRRMRKLVKISVACSVVHILSPRQGLRVLLIHQDT